MDFILKKKYWFIGIGVAILAVVFITFYSMNRGVTSESQIHTINVTSEDTYTSVSRHLEEEGVIRSASFMQFILRFKLDKTLFVGVYEIDASWTTTQIIKHFDDQRNAQPNVVTITLPSGGWAKDFAALLGEETNLEADEILATWNDADYIESLVETYPFLNEVLTLDDLKVKLEGYLYPDTYEFKRITTIDDVTHTILNNMAKVLDSFADEIEQSRFSVHELLTLASIVNYEGNTEASMRTIANVFINRLDINMTLGSSVTICYALQTYESWQECERNIDIDSPFNTYIHLGLPPGPVMNPVSLAIEAVLNPDDTDYLYFVADVTTGEIYFAKTYEEHQRNVEKYVDPHR
ncbi:hypothetical protein AOC36_02130 [Erysipelothrix larvae]|uniref:Endolytic murein transglycosylase n=1 Tax=Erysipelothrix larvae TaxID=1514105 RepID=A0A0X8GYN5_9FIRM|nr:endolytic transglycosylase MltG [Erysipelothrix larvae]AMC92824.1 hypothetical protein AOC36_02130 [Erysipelothrix larvae]